MIGVIKKVDANWLEGILGGQYGIFPVNFMRVSLNNLFKFVLFLFRGQSDEIVFFAYYSLIKPLKK